MINNVWRFALKWGVGTFLGTALVLTLGILWLVWMNGSPLVSWEFLWGVFLVSLHLGTFMFFQGPIVDWLQRTSQDENEGARFIKSIFFGIFEIGWLLGGFVLITLLF